MQELMQPPSDNIVTVIAAVVTVIGTIAGVVVANRLTAVRSSKERIWDFRRVAYSQILSELGDIERICDDADEYINERGFNEYWGTKTRKDNDDEVARRMKIISNRLSADYLILSDKFIKAYDSFANDARSDPYNASPDEEHDTFASAVRKHRPLLTALARSEMDIKS
jgi:hypothetical protein